MKILAVFSALLIALAATQAAEKKPTSHVSRGAAIELLRQEGILHGKTHVLSANWGDATHEWLITLRHPSGALSAWFVDAAAQNYHGGPCKR
jgi:hypothetical protein